MERVVIIIVDEDIKVKRLSKLIQKQHSFMWKFQPEDTNTKLLKQMGIKL